jgi:hypothetical protein
MPTTRRVTLVLITALALTGCGDDKVQSAQDKAQDAAQNAGDKAQQKAYEAVTIAALAAIDRNLAANPTNALVEAKAMCAVIKNKNANQATAEAKKRFTTTKVKVNDAMAKQIVTVLKKDLCPKLS